MSWLDKAQLRTRWFDLPIPALWFTEMKVIDAVEVHVFSVPRKGTLPHAEVEVGCVDSIDADAIVFFHKVKNGA